MNQTMSTGAVVTDWLPAHKSGACASMRAANRKLNLVVGGSVGDDPYDCRTWSGSAAHLTRALEETKCLDQAIGLHLPPWQDAILKARNYSTAYSTWRLNFYLDSAYRNALTRSAAKMDAVRQSTSPFVQIGAMYSLPQAVEHRVPCFSYHDGNIVEALKSGYGFKGVSAKRIDGAIRYEQKVAREMTGVFTFSEYLRKSFIADFGLDENRVFNVGGGVNIDDMPEAVPNKNYARREILFVGADFERKGGNQLLSAFRIVRNTLPDAKLHIVGPRHIPPGADRPGIIFHGNLNKSVPAERNELYRLYRSSSFFVLPSKYEPFGIAPLEAMLFQLPCIVTDGWALREFVMPGVNGALVEKDSVDNLVAALLTFCNSPDKLAQMGQRSRETVLGNYLWPRVVAKMAAAANLN